MTDWSSYVAEYHEERPGISEELLGCARDADGRTPYDWLSEAVPVGIPVVDVACGSGPVLRRVAAGGIGVDRSMAELRCARGHDRAAALVRADAAALPLRSASADAVTVSLALMVATPLADVLAEIARVLRSGGVFAATVPVRSERVDPVFARVLHDLGQDAIRYPNVVSAADLATTGLTVTEDGRRAFVRPVPTEADAALVARAFYAPGATAAQVAAAARRLASRPVEVTFTIRRIVAVA